MLLLMSASEVIDEFDLSASASFSAPLVSILLSMT
jgi:hypothetical protein